MKLRNALSLSALACLPVLASAQGCAVDETPEAQTPNNVTQVNHSFRGKWAVDMKKVDQEYGTSSAYFLGVTAVEAGLQEGLPPVWDQTAKREPNGELHQESGTEIAVIDREGNQIDPAGYVNIIPMLKDTDPSKQVHIREFMSDGDVIVYFHPEQTGARGAMERRASHVGMHYEFKTEGGQELVHHIDNPNSYGPMYNHKPERQMPFHVYRFKPRKGDMVGSAPSNVTETHEGIGFTTPQSSDVLALVNQGDISDQEARKALHHKLDIEIGMRADAAGHIVQYRFHNGSIDNLQILAAIPRVGPAALTTLRDSVTSDSTGTPLTAEMAAAYGKHSRDWAVITNDLSPFANFFDLRLQTRADLDQFAVSAINGQQIPSVYCSGLAYTNLNLALNFPLNAGGLGADLYETFQSTNYYFSDANGDVPASQLVDEMGLESLNRLVFEPYAASDILNAWIENYWGAIPTEMKLGIFQTPEFQQSVVQGFSQLEWSDDQSDEKQSSGEFKPATVENVQRWALAYARPAEATEGYLANDAKLAEAFGELGISSEGMTPMDVLQAVEGASVSNKFVPPQIWMDEADKDDSSLVYVGTVLNCEILSTVDGSGEEACALSGGGVSIWSEGASDSSTYPDFAVENGGSKTHRRFDVAGPSHWGPESTVSARLSHGDVADVRFVLHVPTNWEGHPGADLPYQEYRAWCREAEANGGTCAANSGILLEPNAGGPVDDQTFTWKLGDVCSFSPDGTTATCPMATTVDGFQVLEAVELKTWADGGRVSVSMADLGNASAAELNNCSACSTGGGQYNQFKVTFNQPSEANTPVDGGGDDGGNANSCTGVCGDQAAGGCWCDDQCADNDDCCEDYASVCGG
jgi:Somatomedin B domain